MELTCLLVTGEHRGAQVADVRRWLEERGLSVCKQAAPADPRCRPPDRRERPEQADPTSRARPDGVRGRHARDVDRGTAPRTAQTSPPETGSRPEVACVS